MENGSLLAWFLCALALAVSGCSQAAGPERELSGQVVYDRHCARCHGRDGRPTKEAPTARDLSNGSYMRSLSDRAIRRTIMMGKPPAMPAFGGQFLDPELALLVAYVRTLAPPPPEAEEAERGSP